MEVGASADWSDTSPLAWLTEESLTVTPEAGPASLVLLNKLATGYYRVNYDAETWGRIADLLVTDHQAIHPFNRLGLGWLLS